MEKTIREICLVCKGERWLEDPFKPGQSLPCDYCAHTGWVEVAPSNFPPQKVEPPGPGPRRRR